MRGDRYDDDRLAQRTRTTRATISRIRRKKQRPSWSLVDRIIVISKGAVTANDFVSPQAQRYLKSRPAA